MFYRSRRKCSLIGSLLAAAIQLVAAPALGADVVSTWDGTTNNWTSNHWSSPNFPNNGNGGLTYDVVLFGGTVTLNQNISIEKLSLFGATVTGGNNLSLSSINWTNGGFAGSGTTTIGSGTISGAANKLIDSRTLRVVGNVNWSDGNILRPSPAATRGAVVIENGATFMASGAPSSNRDLAVNMQVNSGGKFLNTGTRGTFLGHVVFDGPGATLVNNGIVETTAGSHLSIPGGNGNGSFVVGNNATLIALLNTSANEFQYTGDVILDNGIFDILVWNGGNVQFALPSSLRGTGTVNVDTLVNTKLIGPGKPSGNKIGALAVQGNYQQTPEAVLAIDIAGTSPTQFDTLNVSGSATLGGKLEFDASALDSTAVGSTIQILSAGSLTGAFDRVETIGSDEIYVRPIYDYGSGGGGGSASGQLCDRGDMNCDGLLNSDDTHAFAVALRDLDAYFETYLTFTASGGDLDGLADGDFHPNGRIDFDDIDDFATLVSGAASGASHSRVVAEILAQAGVPEPATGMLLMSGVLLPIAMFCRGARNHMDIPCRSHIIRCPKMRAVAGSAGRWT